jgi:pimeloyl-ACP methyl ester carboxylesterase
MTAILVKHFESAGLQLTYREYGQKGAPLVIVHHGFLDCAAAWDDVVSSWSEQFHIAAIDARGHGDSEWVGTGGAYWFPDYVLDLSALMEHLGTSKDHPCALVGHSMGGAVCSYTAGTYPDQVKAIALIEGLGPPKYPWSHAPIHMRQFVESTRKRQAQREPEVMEGVEAAANRLRQYDRLLTPDQAQRHAHIATRPVKGGCVWKWDPLHRARMGTMYVEEIAIALLSQITSPALLITGSESPFRQIDASARRNALKNAQDITIDAAGHNLHRHQPEVLSDTLRDFLAETM